MMAEFSIYFFQPGQHSKNIRALCTLTRFIWMKTVKRILSIRTIRLSCLLCFSTALILNDTQMFSSSLDQLGYLMLLFVTLAAIILCIIRRKCKLRRDGLISTFIDTIVAFINGGNLQMKHKLERYFFGIVLAAAFFITSIFSGSILFYVYRIMDQKIDTFEELGNVKSPIYINYGFGPFSDDVQQMLRFVKPIF